MPSPPSPSPSNRPTMSSSIRQTSLALTSHDRINNFQDGFDDGKDSFASPSSFEGSMILTGAIAMNKERQVKFPMPLCITADAPLGVKGFLDHGGNNNIASKRHGGIIAAHH